jgi:tungstate transport system ATP-binding protein
MSALAPRAADRSILPFSADGLCFAAAGNMLINDLSFTLEAGPRTIILGPNGAGKSLLLRLCHGLIAPTAGRLSWGTANGTTARRAQAMVFQRPVMLRRSVAANVDYALALRRIPPTERHERIDEALARTGLKDFARRQARVLSFGEQQKLALARAWAVEPQVLFLDEPTASLDPAATRAVETIIAAIHAAGTKIVMTTHDLGQARRLGDEILFMNKGKLIEKAPAPRFFDTPESTEAKAFLRGDLLW